MKTILLSVTTNRGFRAAGVTFNVVIVRKGEQYGHRDCLTHEGDDPLVEFYDADYAGKEGFTDAGQFVSRYYVSTLLDPHRCRFGLNLCGHEPKWQIDTKDMDPVLDALKKL